MQRLKQEVLLHLKIFTFKFRSYVRNPGEDKPHGERITEATGVDGGGYRAVHHDGAFGGAKLFQERIYSQVVTVEDKAVANSDHNGDDRGVNQDILVQHFQSLWQGFGKKYVLGLASKN